MEAAVFEVEVISRDTIRPSSPTPSHLRRYCLSFLDQIAPTVFMPLILFYPKTTTTTITATTNNLNQPDKSNHLKNSLSETLTKFYPLAGRLVNNVYVDCSDAGVPYTEARAHCRLSELISDPVPGECNKLLPCELADVGDLPLAVRVNFFECGGVAVALAISHKVVDALSFVVFVNSWAAVARGDCDVPPPRLDAAEIFPPRDMGGFQPSTGIVKDPIVTKRFVFTATKIASLRDKCTDNSSLRRPTRIEALSTFLWTRFMASICSEKDPNKIYTLLHAVNLRTRTDPPLSDHYLGNIYRMAIAVPSTDGKLECHEIVKQVRDVTRKVDIDYVRMLREGDDHLSFLRDRAEKFIKGEMVSFGFTSLCNFPLYEAEFKWGKPIWVSSASMPFKNLVCFLDARSGDGGIEAWVNMKEEDMAKFEVDEELLAFVIPKKDARIF